MRKERKKVGRKEGWELFFYYTAQITEFYHETVILTVINTGTYDYAQSVLTLGDNRGALEDQGGS